MHRILDEEEAAELCLRLARPGDLVVLTPTEVEAMWRQVLDFAPGRPPVRPTHPAAQAAPPFTPRIAALGGEAGLIAGGANICCVWPRNGTPLPWGLPPFPEPEGAEVSADAALDKVRP